MYNGPCCQQNGETPRPQAMRERTKLELLEAQRDKLLQEMENITEAIEILKAHPEFEAYARFNQLTHRL